MASKHLACEGEVEIIVMVYDLRLSKVVPRQLSDLFCLKTPGIARGGLGMAIDLRSRSYRLIISFGLGFNALQQ